MRAGWNWQWRRAIFKEARIDAPPAALLREGRDAMTPVPETFALVALFVLRLGVPLAITLLITWGLRSLDARWQADAEARQAAAIVAAGEMLPAAFKAPQARQFPCWTLRNCAETRQSACAACTEPKLPCWMARLRADGRLPSTCYGCALFRLRPRLEVNLV